MAKYTVYANNVSVGVGGNNIQIKSNLGITVLQD